MKRTWLLLPFLALFLVSCGDDVGPDGGLVGGECRDDGDCEERCIRKKDFPSGMCSVSCRDDRDCPSDTMCIDKEGGICAYECREHADCRREYICDSKDRKGAGGEVFICIGD